jgi:hypothetical protein
MIRSVIYIPMEYDDKGEPTVPDWNYDGDNTPIAAAVEEWYQRDRLTRSGSIVVAKVEETDEIPPESYWDDIKNACECDWKPGDPWRKWLGCVEVRVTTREIAKP